MVIITGVSKGIGKALAEAYLNQGVKVIGIGRKNTLEHENYEFHEADLSIHDQVLLLLPLIKMWAQNEKELTFIHNAGVIGEINRFSTKSNDTAKVFQINVFSGIEIAHTILQNRPKDRTFNCIFMSSGAGKRPVPSWSAYCSSKAAVDLFLQTVYQEEIELGRTHFRCHSISPGVVDTDMQAEIRRTREADFSSRNTFKSYYDRLELENPRSVAKKIVQFLEKSEENQVVISVKDFR